MKRKNKVFIYKPCQSHSVRYGHRFLAFTVSVNSSNPPCKDGTVRITMGLLNYFLINNVEDFPFFKV